MKSNYPALNSCAPDELQQLLEIIAEEVNVNEVVFHKDNGDIVRYNRK